MHGAPEHVHVMQASIHQSLQVHFIAFAANEWA